MNSCTSLEGTITLTKELERLKELTNFNEDLEVVWIPCTNSDKEGNIIGKTIYIYSTTILEAKRTLRHEFIDYLVCKAIEPYLQLTNVLLSLISERAYRKKGEGGGSSAENFRGASS